jgi:Flagellar transcriptional activator (FlhC)
MIQHEARTTTIALWTGLTKYRIQTLFRAYQHAGDHRRHRGAAPSQPAFFSRSLTHECEASALAYIGLQMEIIPPMVVPDALHSLPGLARGERLVTAFELYRTLVRQSRMSLEHAVLLMTELAHRRTLSLEKCRICDGLMVVDRLDVRKLSCAFCRLERQAATMATKEARAPTDGTFESPSSDYSGNKNSISA